MFVIRRNIVYVGGIAENVTEEILHAAFIPFGIIKSIQIPRDSSNKKHRGFAFVEFEEEEDASESIENMDGAELFGKVIRCNLAKAMPKLASGQAVWNSEEWVRQKLVSEGNSDAMETEKTAELTLVPDRENDYDDDILE